MVDICLGFGYYNSNEQVYKLIGREVILMLKRNDNCHSKIAIIIAAIAAVTAIATTITAFLVIREKKRKKQDKELDEYLDCSIQ